MKTIRSHAQEVQLAAWFAEAVYGQTQLRGESHEFETGGFIDFETENGWGDDYEGYVAARAPIGRGTWDVLPGSLESDLNFFVQPGGLLVMTPEQLADPTNFFQELSFDIAGTAEALIVEGVIDGKNTLVYAFRGTDTAGDGTAAKLGQAWTPEGLTAHYAMHRVWLDSAISHANTANIDQMIVTGHSLGGAMVDMFAAFDAERVEPDLLMVAMGAAGLTGPTLFGARPSAVEYASQLFGPPNANFVQDDALRRTDDYIGFAHSDDPVFYPGTNDELTSPVRALDNNIHPAGDTHRITLPNVDNGSVPLLEFNGFGREHSIIRYSDNIGHLTNDPALAFISNDNFNIVMGTAGRSDRPGNGPYGRLDGGSSDDWILGLSGNDMVFANDGNDVISGGSGNDDLFGGNGNDRIHGGSGIDTVSGGNGRDGAAFFGPIVGPGEYALLEMDLNTNIATFDVYSDESRTDEHFLRTFEEGWFSIEDVYATEADDVIRGSDVNNSIRTYGGDDLILGRRGADTIIAGDGNDTLDGGVNADLLDGGRGIDTALYASNDVGIRVTAGSSTASGGFAEGDRLRSIENIVGSTFGDEINGDDADNTFWGEDGADSLIGGLGDDTLWGGDGADVIFGGDGTDVILGGAGSDVIYGDGA